MYTSRLGEEEAAWGGIKSMEKKEACRENHMKREFTGVKANKNEVNPSTSGGGL